MTHGAYILAGLVIGIFCTPLIICLSVIAVKKLTRIAQNLRERGR